MTKTEILSMVDRDVDRTIKIQGTDYDRKRKLKSKAVAEMRKLVSKGKTFKEIADRLGCCTQTVRYNVDDEWRKAYNANRSGAHTGKDHISITNRIAYKRQLVAAGKVSA